MPSKKTTDLKLQDLNRHVSDEQDEAMTAQGGFVSFPQTVPDSVKGRARGEADIVPSPALSMANTPNALAPRRPTASPRLRPKRRTHV